MRQRERVTILDVAALAGVHAATVSRALSRPEKVAAATRQRVEDAVEELGFVPNRAARGLITGRTENVAVIVPDITNPHFASMVRSVQGTARDADLHVVLVDTGEHPDEEVRAVRTLSREVDGFIVLSPRRLHLELDALGSTPAVFVNRPVRGRACVLLRTAPAVGDMLVHLASLGHRSLAYLGGPSGSWAAGERLRAVRQSSHDGGLDLVEIAADGPTFDDAAAVVDEIAHRRVSAVMAFNDQMALGVIAGLSRRGLSVPGDMSVVGIDDVPMAAMVAPPLTTISLPTLEAGAAALRKLGEDVTRTELFGTLVIRDSTGPATGPALGVTGSGAATAPGRPRS